MRRHVPTLDSALGAHAHLLGPDLEGYRNHTYRVCNLCDALHGDATDDLEKTAVAAAFHDLGIWTDRTFDYLLPSVALAESYLRSVGRPAWIDEVRAMILQHHKVFPSGEAPGSLVEAFRQADWVDVSRGTLRFGVPRAFVRELYTVWPGAGFHGRLVQLSWRRWRTHPLSPLPMLRW